MQRSVKIKNYHISLSCTSPCSVVRHKLATQGPFEVADKFRIDIYSDKQLVGRKQLLSRLLKGSPLKREVGACWSVLAQWPRCMCVSVNAVLELGHSLISY